MTYCIFKLHPRHYRSYPISFHPRYYPSSIMSSAAQKRHKYVFNCESRCLFTGFKTCRRRAIPESTRPSRIRTPIVFLQTLHPLPLHLRFPPSLVPDHPQMSRLKQPAGSTLQQSGGSPSSLPSSPFSFGGAMSGMPKMAVDHSGEYTECVFGAWVGCDEDSCKQERERVLVGRWKKGSEDMDMQAHRVTLNRLAWSKTPGGRFTG